MVDRPPGVDDDLPPSAAFRAVVAENPAVCSRCLRRLARYDPLPATVGEDYGDLMAAVTHDGDGETTIRSLEPNRVTRTAPDGGDDPTEGERPVCAECGTTYTASAPPFDLPRSTPDLTRHAEHVSRTLHEYGVDHDPHVLRGTARELKTNSYETGATDDEILSRATEAAITAALSAPDGD